jgi:type II secretory pathway component PulK
MRSRRGFALLAVLWTMMGVSALAMVALIAAREAVATAQYRTAVLRGTWFAEDCIARARAAIDVALTDDESLWRGLDSLVPRSPLVTSAGCDVRLVPTGVALNVNAATGDQLRALFRALDLGGPRADSMADAVLDWCDADDDPRPFGAERAWYIANGRFPPRNGPIASLDELRHVRGFDPVTLPDSVLRSVLTVEPGRIVWDRAPLAVLASLPGVTPPVLAQVANQRAHGLAINVADLVGSNAIELQALTAAEPDRWLLTARSGPATIELALAHTGRRAAIVRRRTMP